MHKIEIVSHCWRYSRVLRYQLSSLLLYATSADVTMTVFYTPEDSPTVAILKTFRNHIAGLRAWPLPRPQLLARAIGRNLAAQQTLADVVWFTDCDYLFGPGCLQTLAAADLSGSPLWFPPLTHFTKTRQLGDNYAHWADPALIGDDVVLEIDPLHLTQHRLRRAIGGVQIVPGDVARKFGYCDGNQRQQRPVADDDTNFRRNHSDKHFRRSLGTGGSKLDLPNVWRIRQSQFGRVDQDLTIKE